MKIALALQGKEQMLFQEQATQSSKMGAATLICFLCNDYK